MAIILLGKTRCAACGEVLQDGDEIIGLPHFTGDKDDPDWPYTDSGFHASCWDDLPERERIENRINSLDREHGYTPRFG